MNYIPLEQNSLCSTIKANNTLFEESFSCGRSSLISVWKRHSYPAAAFWSLLRLLSSSVNLNPRRYPCNIRTCAKLTGVWKIPTTGEMSLWLHKAQRTFNRFTMSSGLFKPSFCIHTEKFKTWVLALSHVLLRTNFL